MAAADHYLVLGVPRNSSAAEIRSAYVTLARDRHPDKVKDAAERKKAVEFFKTLTAAYDVLSRERNRKDYDARYPQAGTSVPALMKTAATTKPLAGAAAPKPASPATVTAQRPATTTAAAPPPSQSGPQPIQGGQADVDVLTAGLEAFKKQDYHSAIQFLRIAITRNENDHRAHAFLGMALAKNPNWVRDGIQHLETAAKLQPKNPSYLAELALLLQGQGLRLRARRALEQALVLAPDHPDVRRAQSEIPLNDATGEVSAGHTGTTGEVGRSLLNRLRGK